MDGKKDPGGIRRLLDGTRGYLLVALFTVSLYSLFQNFDRISASVGRVVGILSPVFWAMAIAFVVNMPMRFLENKVLKRWPACAAKRVVALALAFLFVAAIIATIMLLIVPKFVESAQIIIANFDTYVVSLGTWSSELRDWLNLTDSDITWLETVLQNLYDYVDALVSQALPTVVKLTVNVASVMISLVLALIMSCYALFNKENYMWGAKRLLSTVLNGSRRERVLAVCGRTNWALNAYFRGMILECAILGTMCFIGMTIFRFPYALLISVIVGVTQIVPIIGPWVSAILGALIILMTEPSMALWFLVFIVIVQQIEANLIYPRVVGNMVGLSGIWVIVAILLGGGLFGIAGIILCVPLTAVIQTLIKEWVDARLARQAEVEAVDAALPQEPPMPQDAPAPIPEAPIVQRAEASAKGKGKKNRKK